MSKKPAKSDRHVEIPDWAEDVTPADEVMKKFYAPTGSFKSGPIAAPEAFEEPHSQHTSAASPATNQPLETAKIQEDEGKAEIILPPLRASREQLPQALTLAPMGDEETATSEPASAQASQVSEPGSAEPIETKSPLGLEPAIVSAPPSPGTQSAFFEDFARKWRQYLYPGQLAVMRTLYELTYAVGTNECFTRYSEIAGATKMSRRNCINVVNSLVKGGFIERVEIRNDASGKGIRLRIHLEPLQPLH